MNKMISNSTGILLFRQLAAATRNKLPYHETLHILAQDPDMFGRDFPAVEALSRQLADGCVLSAALQRLPELVPAETAELVKTAEGAGNLAQILDAIADDYTEQEQRGISLRAALLWPLAITVVAALLVFMMMIFVIPQYEKLFEAFGSRLPLPTLILIAVSHAFLEWGWVIVVLLVVMFFLQRANRLPPPITLAVQRILLGIPYLRKYLVQAFTVRVINWIRAAHQDPQLMLAALRHLRATTGFSAFALCLLNLESRLTGAQPLSHALLGLWPLPKRVALLMQLGEKAGDAQGALSQVADFSESERMAGLARFERFLILSVYCVLGITVGLIVLAMYLPIFAMGEAVGS